MTHFDEPAFVFENRAEKKKKPKKNINSGNVVNSSFPRSESIEQLRINKT